MSDAEASGSGKIETRTAAEQVDDLDTLVTMSGEALHGLILEGLAGGSAL